MNKRRQMLTGYLHAKMEADEGVLAEEGCHGMWELSINRDNHADIRMDRLIALLSKLESKSVRVRGGAGMTGTGGQLGGQGGK